MLRSRYPHSLISNDAVRVKDVCFSGARQGHFWFKIKLSPRLKVKIQTHPSSLTLRNPDLTRLKPSQLTKKRYEHVTFTKTANISIVSQPVTAWPGNALNCRPTDRKYQ